MIRYILPAGRRVLMSNMNAINARAGGAALALRPQRWATGSHVELPAHDRPHLSGEIVAPCLSRLVGASYAGPSLRFESFAPTTVSPGEANLRRWSPNFRLARVPHLPDRPPQTDLADGTREASATGVRPPPVSRVIRAQQRANAGLPNIHQSLRFVGKGKLVSEGANGLSWPARR